MGRFWGGLRNFGGGSLNTPKPLSVRHCCLDFLFLEENVSSRPTHVIMLACYYKFPSAVMVEDLIFQEPCICECVQQTEVIPRSCKADWCHTDSASCSTVHMVCYMIVHALTPIRVTPNSHSDDFYLPRTPAGINSLSSAMECKLFNDSVAFGG